MTYNFGPDFKYPMPDKPDGVTVACVCLCVCVSVCVCVCVCCVCSECVIKKTHVLDERTGSLKEAAFGCTLV